MTTKKIVLNKNDYVLFKNGKPIEPLDIIYAKESMQQLLADGFELKNGESFISMTELSKEWQQKYINKLYTIYTKSEPKHISEVIDQALEDLLK